MKTFHTHHAKHHFPSHRFVNQEDLNKIVETISSVAETAWEHKGKVLGVIGGGLALFAMQNKIAKDKPLRDKIRKKNEEVED